MHNKCNSLKPSKSVLASAILASLLTLTNQALATPHNDKANALDVPQDQLVTIKSNYASDQTLEIAKQIANSLTVFNGRVIYDHALIPFGYKVDLKANYEQIVGSDGTIYTPLVDTKVKIAVIVNGLNKARDEAIAEKEVFIKGLHAQNDGNLKPRVIPEIAQWYSSVEQKDLFYKLSSSSRLVVDQELFDYAKTLQSEIKDLFNYELTIADSSSPIEKGDIILSLDQELLGFDKESYSLEINDTITVKATDLIGLNWGTRSLLQAFKLSDNKSIAYGSAKDYPEFPVRSFMIDVGRKPLSLDMLKNIAKTMSWYKLNDLHVHLNDNNIFMEDYRDAGKSEEETWEAYAAFRVESNKTGLAAKDYHYTKQEIKDFIAQSRAMGVDIIPEFDVPAHALAYTYYIKNTLKRPDLVLHQMDGQHPWLDHIDIKKQEGIELAKDLFNEYIDENVFDEKTIVHFGADEFYESHPAYRNFVKQMISFMKNDKQRETRLWGSLSTMSNEPHLHSVSPQDVQGAQMNIWNLQWAQPQDMYSLGFKLINTEDTILYMGPAYGEFLRGEEIYNTWSPEKIGTTIVPAGSDLMLGACYALWQGDIDTRASGFDEQDTFYRFNDGLIPLSVKMWGIGADGLDRKEYQSLLADADKIGDAPLSNAYSKVKADIHGVYAHYTFDDTNDSSSNQYNLELNNAEINNNSLILKGKNSFAKTGLNRLTWGDELSITLKKTGPVTHEEILLESDFAYGQYAIKVLPGSTSNTFKIGFSRELFDYVYPQELNINEVIKLKFVSKRKNTELVINDSKVISPIGEFKSKPDSNSKFMGKSGITSSSLNLPVAYIGSRTNSFVGEIYELKMQQFTTNKKDYLLR